jgi:peptidoglycan/LPS O-acetylase OafA/YrhL
MLIPYLNLLSLDVTFTNDSHYWVLNYFSGFLGYWLLGYYLRLYPIKIGVNKKWIALCIGVITYVVAIAIIKLKGLDVTPYMDNLQIGSAFLVAMLYTVIQSNPIKVKFIRNIVSELAKYSFGIYLVHIVVVRDIVWELFQSSTIHPLPETFLIAAISMIACYSIIKLISYLPFSKYTIGV